MNNNKTITEEQIDNLVAKVRKAQENKGASDIKIDRGKEGMHLSYNLNGVEHCTYTLYKDWI